MLRWTGLRSGRRMRHRPEPRHRARQTAFAWLEHGIVKADAIPDDNRLYHRRLYRRFHGWLPCFLHRGRHLDFVRRMKNGPLIREPAGEASASTLTVTDMD